MKTTGTTWDREAYDRRMAAERELWAKHFEQGRPDGKVKLLMRPMTESQLQIAVIEHLRLRGVPGLLYFKIPNEGKRTRANGARMKAEGLLPGVADLFIKAPDRVPLFLELKRKGQEPTPDQSAFGEHAYRCGCDWGYADSLDGALEMLTKYGAFR